MRISTHGGNEGIHCEYEPGTFRTKANKDNDYLIDRKSQTEKRAFSGVSGFAVQDSPLQEAWDRYKTFRERSCYQPMARS